MEYHLVVTEAFNGYQKGDKITDQEEIARLLDSEWKSHFVKIQA